MSGKSDPYSLSNNLFSLLLLRSHSLDSAKKLASSSTPLSPKGGVGYGSHRRRVNAVLATVGVCAIVRSCVRACVGACVRACMHVFVRNELAM